MFGITKSENLYWVKVGTSTKVGHKSVWSAIAHLITGIA